MKYCHQFASLSLSVMTDWVITNLGTLSPLSPLNSWSPPAVTRLGAGNPPPPLALPRQSSPPLLSACRTLPHCYWLPQDGLPLDCPGVSLCFSWRKAGQILKITTNKDKYNKETNGVFNVFLTALWNSEDNIYNTHTSRIQQVEFRLV